VSIFGLVVWIVGRIAGKGRTGDRPPAPDAAPDLLSAPIQASPKLVIHRAVYGAGPRDELLATDKLQNAARDALVINVDSTLGNLLPRDPAVGVRKRLDVDYSYGSDTVIHTSRLEAPAGETVRFLLPEDSKVQKVQRLTDEIGRMNNNTKGKNIGLVKSGMML
jgi:hypothetical protein